MIKLGTEMKIRKILFGLLVAIFLSLISGIGGEESILDSAIGGLSWTVRLKRRIPFLSRWFSSSSNERKSSAGDYSFARSNLTSDGGVQSDPRDPRFLSLFTVVRFDNTQCLSASGDNGTCYPQSECNRRGGAANGKCAQGYGSCCVFSKSCGSTTRQNNTYFTHGGYPTAFDGTGSCQMTVYKAHRDVCQYRLDFDSFNIAQPNMNGVCNNDQFIISGVSTTVPIICGINSGNHMYLEVAPDNTPITLSVITSGPAYSRTWKIKITQIRCPSSYKAPEGCLQYFMGVSGTIRTYNFDFVGGMQLANQDYSSCIRMERNFCGIRYTGCQDSQNQAGGNLGNLRSRAFSITGNLDAAASKVGATMCNTDWVIIPCATNTGRMMQTGGTGCQDRLCGDVFNSEASAQSSPVFSYVKPFRITYHTNEDESVDVMNRGYCLNYIQQPCTPTQ